MLFRTLASKLASEISVRILAITTGMRFTWAPAPRNNGCRHSVSIAVNQVVSLARFAGYSEVIVEVKFIDRLIANSELGTCSCPFRDLVIDDHAVLLIGIVPGESTAGFADGRVGPT